MSVPTPIPAGPPIPYWPSVVVKPETLRGVQTYHVGLILDIIFGLFALTIGISALFLASSTVPGAIAAGAILGSAACGLVIVFVINFIVSLMSVLKMHHGANEYGPEHALNAKRGIMFKWIGTTLSTLAAILVVYLLFVGGSSFVGSGTIPTIAFVPLLVTVFWTAGVTAKGQMYRFMIRSLQPPETRRWSDIASLLIPALGIIGIGAVGYVTARFISILTNPAGVNGNEVAQLFPVLIGGVFLPPGLALVGYIVFLWVYSRTKARLNDGLLRLYAAVPPPVAWAYPAPYPAPYAAPYQTPYPAAPYQPGPATPSAPPAAPTTPSGPPAAMPNSTPASNLTCPRCGLPSPSTSAFCGNCGAPLRA